MDSAKFEPFQDLQPAVGSDEFGCTAQVVALGAILLVIRNKRLVVVRAASPSVTFVLTEATPDVPHDKSVMTKTPGLTRRAFGKEFEMGFTQAVQKRPKDHGGCHGRVLDPTPGSLEASPGIEE